LRARQQGAPVQAGAEGGEHDGSIEAIRGSPPFGCGDQQRRGRGVAVSPEILEKAIVGHPERTRDPGQKIRIRLMEDIPADVAAVQWE